MDWSSRAFLKASLAWFGIGTTLGAVMTVLPSTMMYRAAHFHLNLLGFVSMMIYGVAYHVIPRFVGHPLHRPQLAIAHWWIANAGLLVLTIGFALVASLGAVAFPVQAIGGAMSAIGAYLFIYNLWRTLDGTPVLRRAHRATRPLPVVAEGE